MGYYWKLTKENIRELKERFRKFAKDCEWHINHLYDLDEADFNYSRNRINQDYYYKTHEEKVELLRKRRDDIIGRYKRRMNELNQLIETFEFFIQVAEFTQFTSADYGYHLKFKFYDGVIDRVKDPNVPANQFWVSFSGAHWKFDDFNIFRFNAEGITPQFDRFYM